TLTVVAAVAAALATAMSIAQVMLLRRQLKNEDRVRVATFYQNVQALFLRLDLIFLERPELRPYFYDGQAPTDATTALQVNALAEYITDMAESCTAAEDVLPELIGDWDDFFNYIYRSSPALREYWDEFGHLFPARVKRALTGP